MTAKTYHILKNTRYKTHFYTFLHMCKWIFLGLHMCKLIFLGLHMCMWIFWFTHMCKWIFLVYTFLHIHFYTGMKPNRIRMPRRTPLVIRGCSILRPFGQQLSLILYFFQIKIVQPKAQKHHQIFKCSKEIRRKLTKQRFL